MSISVEEYQELRKEVPIQSAVINITDECNLRCKYCFTHHNSQVITPEILHKTVDFLRAEQERTGKKYTPSISFFGGEPTLHFDDIIRPFIEWCKKENFKCEFNMTTNGVLLTEDRLKYMSEVPIHPLLSIDGAKRTQDAQRPLKGGNGSSFDLIEKNIDNILKYFPTITFRSAIEPENVDFMVENYMFAREKGFRNYFIIPNTYSTAWEDTAIFKLVGFLKVISEVMLFDILENGQALLFDDIFKYIKARIQRETGEVKDELSFNRCGLGINGIGVGCDGTINGCQEHNTYHDEGDVFQIGTLNTGINVDRHIELLNAYSDISKTYCIDNPELCETCEFRPTCSPRTCPSRNISIYKYGACNNLVTCRWQQMLDLIAKDWILRADFDNENFKKVIKERVI